MSKHWIEMSSFKPPPKVPLSDSVLKSCKSEIKRFADRYPIGSHETIPISKKNRLLPRYKAKRPIRPVLREPSRTKSAIITPLKTESSELLETTPELKYSGSQLSLLKNYLINEDDYYKIKLAIHRNRTVEMVRVDGKDKDQEIKTTKPLNKMDEFRYNVLGTETKSVETTHKTHDVIKFLKIKEHQTKMKLPKFEKMRKITLIDYLRHTTDGGPSRVHYFTHGRQIDKFIDVTKKPNPFKLTEYPLGRGREMVTLKCEKRKSPGYLSDTYSSSLQSDILCRLHIPNNEEEILGKLDITPDYWKIVEGRAIKYKLDRKELKFFLEDNLRKKLTAAFLGEEEARCDVKHRIDCSLLPSLEKELYHMETFKAFIHEKYCECLHTVAYAEEIRHIRTQILSTHNKYKTKLKLVTGDLIDIYDVRNRISWCKEVTHKLSPKVWKYGFSTECEKFTSPFLIKIPELMNLYNCKTGLKYIDKLIHKVIKQLIKDIFEFGPPMLYFRNPIEFQALIKDAEFENLQYTIQALELLPQINKINYMVNKLNVHFNGYQKRLLSLKDIFFRLYSKSKEKSEYYNKKLTDYTVKDSYEVLLNPKDPESVITLRLLMEEVYNIIVKHPSGIKTSYAFISEIEAVFLSLWFKIEMYYCNYKNIIDKAVDIVLKREFNRTVMAEQARVKFNKSYKLVKHIQEAVTPYRGGTKFRELKFRSMQDVEVSEEEEPFDVPMKLQKSKPFSFDNVHAIHCPKSFREEIKNMRFESPLDLLKMPPIPVEEYEDDSIYNFICESEKESEVNYDGIAKLDIPPSRSSKSSSMTEFRENALMEQCIDKNRRDLFFIRTWDADIFIKNELDLLSDKEGIKEIKQEDIINELLK
ncbi:hypothetical protein O3M35_000818 [Rhynocoris fuscipes]|uniref:Uncharacterized protein n=1 Tax=Rhynocoris fuscipes TaxID=488301 RepID=A0AAW1DN27_9HEMI